MKLFIPLKMWLTDFAKLSALYLNILSKVLPEEIGSCLAFDLGLVLEVSFTFKKNENGVKAPDRVEAVIQKARERALEYDADPDMIETLYREMISSFINLEMDKFKKTQGKF